MEKIKEKKRVVRKQKDKKKSEIFLDVEKFFGKVKWIEDPVKYQRKLRDGE